MRNRIVLENEIGLCGVNKQKGLFIEYTSFIHNEIQLEYFKPNLDSKYYYLIGNPIISHYGNKSHNKDIMIIHSKIEKLINLILKGCDYRTLSKRYNSLFNFNKYKNDTFDLIEFYNFIKEQEKELKEHIKKIYPMF